MATSSPPTRKKPSSLPSGIMQANIFSLLAQEFDEKALDPAIPAAIRTAPQKQPHATRPQQLSLDALLADLSSSTAVSTPASFHAINTAFDRQEFIRPAPARRTTKNKPAAPRTISGQASFDDLFTALLSEPETITSLPSPETEQPYDGRNQADQAHPEPLGEPQPQEARATQEGGKAGSGIDGDGGEGRGLDSRIDDSAEAGTFDRLGDSSTPDSSGRARGRRSHIALAEPEQRPSRDFRIRPEHNVGAGGLQEKARANLAALRLLKTLEEENREAADEEKAILVRYSGWGALAQMFEPPGWRRNEQWRASWGAIAAELEELLPPDSEEYKAARASTPNAHYTSPLVATAIWETLQRLGVPTGAEVLEPAMGTGNFLGLMPMEGRRTGVELDKITARIAKKLYPDSTIYAQGFEETKLPNNYFDLAVGNPPFGDYGVHDPTIKCAPSVKRACRNSIHDYFFVKSLEKVRPSGIVAFVTSRYTMDKEDATVRKHLAEQADLVGAVRLPNTTFKGNAGTDVVTDILFLQKRAPGAPPGNQSWVETGTIQIDGQPVRLNQYYIDHLEMMLGEMKLIRGMYRENEPTLTGELTPEKLQQALNTLPEGIYTPRDQGRSPPPIAPIAPPEAFIGVKDGGHTEVNGQIVLRSGDRFEPVALSAASAARVRGLMEIRDTVREVFRTQLDDEPEAKITAARLALNRTYDQFARRHGPISSRENLRVFEGDPDYPLLVSLENYDAETKTATKTVVFTQRTLERYKPVDHAETAAEALAISLNETGQIDWRRMEQLTGYSAKEMQAELSGQVYRNPEGGQWETADEYLSGDVRAKQRAATAAAEINPAYAPNIEALGAVQPADLLPGDISARLGASWIPASDIQQFICELLQVPKNDVSVLHAGAIATWDVRLDMLAARTVSNTTTHGTRRYPAADLIEAALNLRTPTVYDSLADGTRVVNQADTLAAREAQQKIKDRFSKWIWEDPSRSERLARFYNDTFNNIRLRTYDGTHLTFPGMNRAGLRNNDLDPHQKAAVWRNITEQNTLIGHCVGAGKTAEITASCMEQKRLGLRKKPMIVVPNHLVEQWGAAFLALYPQANIFVAGKEHFTAGNREKAMARIATGNYDAVIISHKSFESLPVSDATFNRFLYKQVRELEEAILEAKAEKGETRSVVKQLEKAKMRLEARIKARADRDRKDDGVTFEQLGVDQIYVDEADLYKNLGLTTKMNRIAGLPNTESNRAMDMYMKTRYLSERGGGICFATGTPISNTMAEMYTLMRYLAPEQLEAAGLEHFDAWAANFGEAVTNLELAPDGSGYRMHTRFAKFVNLPELLSMFRTFADIQTAEMLKLPRPDLAGGKPQAIVAPASPELREYVSRLVARAERVRSGQVAPETDNMLKITTDGRKAALDMRLVDPEDEPGPDSKIYKAIDNILRIWKETARERSTQLVFCDMSTPAPLTFDAPAHIEAVMTQHQQSPEKIRFVLDAIGPRDKLNKQSDIKAKLSEHDGFSEEGVRIILNAVARGRSFNVYDEIKTQLIALGIPAKEIAFIHDADTDAKKQQLFDAVNAGRIRVLLGSTEKMGAGTNVQKKLVAEHHLDAPWRPRDIEQREGRILRQGNENKEVQIYRYVTENSFDAYMWQTLETKARFIQQVMSGDVTVRNAEDLEGGALSYAEIKAIASGNPLVMEKVAIDTEVRKLDMLRAAHQNQQFTIARQTAALPKAIEESREYRAGLLEDIARRDASLSGEEFSITVGDREISGKGAREEAGTALTKAIMSSLWDGDRTASLKRLGQYKGFAIMSSFSGREGETPKIYLRGKNTYEANLNPENPLGTIASIEYALRRLDRDAEEERTAIERKEKSLADYREQLEHPFEYEARLRELELKQQEINQKLDLDKGDRQVVADGQPEEGKKAPGASELDQAMDQVNADELMHVKAIMQQEEVEAAWTETREKVALDPAQAEAILADERARMEQALGQINPDDILKIKAMMSQEEVEAAWAANRDKVLDQGIAWRGQQPLRPPMVVGQ
jgi:N12 class adenine-specific DNA methylase